MRLFVSFLTLVCFANSVCLAQRSKSRHKNKEEIPVETLISSYRFSEAAEALEKKISLAERRRKPTEDFQLQLDHVHSLQVTLSATEKVKFIDSLVVAKKNFLEAYHLGADCGTLASPQRFLPADFVPGKAFGQVAYINELGDKMHFPVMQADSTTKLFFTARVGDAWSQPKPLKGLADQSGSQDFPYVMSDGVTLYYSAIKEEGLGGYDIYVTRYNPDTDSYLKSDNIGMPFNSMANDYMYAIDEINNLGWFVTDRNQAPDSVCVYIFRPNAVREVYNPMAMGEEAMRRLALIHSISECRLSQPALQQAKERLHKVMTEPTSVLRGDRTRFIINDNCVYTSLLDFKNKDAQRIAMEWEKENRRLTELEHELENLREDYDHATASAEEKKRILALESQIRNLKEVVNILGKNMRKAELQ